MKKNADYEQDFYAWLVYNSQMLRQGRFAEADIENIAEELEGMSRSEKRELVNRLAVLIAHLLKWQFEPERRSNSREGTIEEQRKQIRQLLEESPSLRYEIEQRLIRSYEIAVPKAVRETGMKKTVFPEKCPYMLEQVLDDNFYPDINL